MGVTGWACFVLQWGGGGGQRGGGGRKEDERIGVGGTVVGVREDEDEGSVLWNKGRELPRG